MTQPQPATSSSDEAADDLRAMLAELRRPHRHRETYTRQVGNTLWTGDHITVVPSLLVQLRYAVASGQGAARSGAGFESRPAASLESLATLTMIDLEVSRWVRDLGEDDPTSTAECVRLLGGLLPSTTRCKLTRGRVGCCTWHEVERDVRRWYTQARITTGWDAPAWRPDNTCPNCAVRRSLRIRLAERVGFCVECRETWSPAEYQVLAEHIRSESMAERSIAGPGPCWCPWPADEMVGLAKLCPRCGSARCRHAVRRAGDRPAQSREDEHMPKQPPFQEDPFELALAERLGLPAAAVVAGSFDLVEHRTFAGVEKVSVRWRQVMSVDGEEQIQEQHAEVPYADVQEIQDRLAGLLR